MINDEIFRQIEEFANNNELDNVLAKIDKNIAFLQKRKDEVPPQSMALILQQREELKQHLDTLKNMKDANK